MCLVSEVSAKCMEYRDPTLCRKFVVYAKALLEKHPHLEHQWSMDADEDHCILDFSASDTDGFAVTIEVYPNQITIFALGAHAHYELKEDHGMLIESAMGLVRDLLSPSMRIKAYLSGVKPYRWDIEFLEDGDWKRIDTTALIFWNYFGARRQRIYQNRTLEIRNNTNE